MGNDNLALTPNSHIGRTVKFVPAVKVTAKFGPMDTPAGLSARVDAKKSTGSVAPRTGCFRKRFAHPKTLNKLAALFEVDVSYLLRGEPGAHPAVMREQVREYGGVKLTELLREIEGARDSLDRIAQQLKRATTKPGTAAELTEMAAAGYDRKRGGAGKIQEGEIK